MNLCAVDSQYGVMTTPPISVLIPTLTLYEPFSLFCYNTLSKITISGLLCWFGVGWKLLILSTVRYTINVKCLTIFYSIDPATTDTTLLKICGMWNMDTLTGGA